ncbi:ATP-binding protein [Georgenia subflava]|uniref:OmpR/PhoB-type domain-containing protein n=1 Tax=Georgenia subflava TaxID=1622177 RepID=A0A6N7EJ51_9MICO|nr:BTAD domain-containing putative transcriptional regulator [Georgenia subflava]MPV36216.1 hypothetical protein [Georgenia subflava]
MVAAGLTFGVLGPLQVHRDGVEVAVPSRRQRAVLAALLLRRDETVDVDHLVQAAWGERPPRSPKAALHTVMSRLRGTIGADVVLSEPSGYRLTPTDDALDADRFRAMCDSAAREPPAEALDLTERALRLWRGDFLPEFADSPFAEVEAARLTQRRLAACEERASLQIQLGEVEEAAAGMAALVHDNPLRERAYGLLMRALYLAGRPSEALDHYQAHRQFLVAELGLEPSPELRDLQMQILDHGIPRADRPTLSHPVPRWLVDGTTFVGRADAVAELVDAVASHSLTTVTGPGGVGKSRLAAQVLEGLSRRLAMPAAVAELDAAGPEDVDLAVAAALGLGHVRDAVAEAVLEYLGITPTLLVLDGCEHVRDAVAAFAASVLRHCPRTHLLVTSRRRLAVHAEQVLPLEPLALPPTTTVPGAQPGTAATELFVDRARRVRPGLAFDRDALTAVAAICRRLDGLPLAIELAATRAAALGVVEVRDRLARSLDLLEETDDGGPSVRRTLDWSYGLLSPSEQALLRALAVFEGGFDLASAEHVAPSRTSGSVPADLAGLVDASLVQVHQDGGVRYHLLQLVRSFASERLRRADDADEVHLAHARWVRSCVRSVAERSVGPDDAAAVVGLETDMLNIRAAVSWALGAGHPQLAGEITGTVTLASTMWPVCADLSEIVRKAADSPDVLATSAGPLAQAAGAFVAATRGELATGEREARAALARTAPDATMTADQRTLALSALGVSALYGGDHPQSRRCWWEMLEVDGTSLARRSGAYSSLALIAHYDGDTPAARDLAALALSTAEAAGAVAYRGFARYATAEVVSGEDRSAAVPLFVAAARDAYLVGAQYVGGLANIALLAVLTRSQRRAEALGVVGPLLDRWFRLGAWPQQWTTLRIFAELLAEDRPESAALLLTAADAASSAPAVTGADARRYAKLGADLRAELGTSVFGRITELGSILPRAQVVDRARVTAGELTNGRPQALQPDESARW